MGEDLEEGEVSGELGGGGERLDGGSLEELGEEVGIWGGGSTGD